MGEAVSTHSFILNGILLAAIDDTHARY